jgi:uncharacterized protein with HEPN domain
MSALNDARLNEFLQHMLLAIERIGTYIENQTVDHFLKTPLLQDAVVRNIEVLGEASHQLMKRFPEFTSSHPEIPWEAIYYMRNRIIHGYVSIDFDLVWTVINKDLPQLQNQLRAIKV